MSGQDASFKGAIARVLHVASGDLWAGAEVQVHTLLSTLQRRGDVQIAAAVMNEGELARRLRTARVETFVFPESELGPVQLFGSLRRLMRQWGPDIVHTHRIKENVLASLSNACSVRARSVRTVHGSGETASDRPRDRLMRTMDIACGRLLQDRVIAVSDELADKLAADFPRAMISVVPNGIDADAVLTAAAASPHLPRAPGSVHVGIVGRMVPVKRVDLFLQTAARAMAMRPAIDWQFHVFGDGPLLQRHRNEAKELRIEDRVTFHGHRSDIAACLGSLDVLVMCSDHEGLPMTLLEALALGTPVLAHAVGGMREVLSGGGGVCITDHTADGYARGLCELLDVDREELKRAAQARIERHYSAHRNAQGVIDVYRTLLSQRSRAAVVPS